MLFTHYWINFMSQNVSGWGKRDQLGFRWNTPSIWYEISLKITKLLLSPSHKVCFNCVGYYHYIYFSSSLLLTRIRVFIHIQHRNIAMLSVDKFPFPRKKTRDQEFTPCSKFVCHILKRFRGFNSSAITFIWLKSSHKHSVARWHRSGRESGRRLWSSLWRH